MIIWHIILFPKTVKNMENTHPICSFFTVCCYVLTVFNLNASALALPLCSEQTFTGSNIHLDSQEFVVLVQLTYDTNCTCRVVLPAYTQMTVAPILFYQVIGKLNDAKFIVIKTFSQVIGQDVKSLKCQ